ncbi:hypothetical protein SESBI_29712 [Sesbania bispinosa]|nr:hypothetical protein SESBI_29712 [Sesbania bispinosa]
MSQTKKKEVDITWNHCEAVPPHRLCVKCKYCSHTCWGGIARMKHHFSGTRENVAACTSVPDEVKKMFVKLLQDRQKAKEATSQECFEEGTQVQDARKGKGGTSASMKQKTMNEVLKDRDLVIQDICKCIYGNALAFNLLHRPLHAAAYYLNPKFHYDKNFNPDSEVLFGLYETIERMVPDRRIRFGIDQQLDRFKTAKGLFGMTMAIDTREKKQPEDESEVEEIIAIGEEGEEEHLTEEDEDELSDVDLGDDE